MRRYKLLLFAMGLLLSCDSELPQKRFSMKIFTYSSIGGESEPLPSEIIDLSTPFSYSCKDSVMTFLSVDAKMKTPILYRSDNNNQYDISVDLEGFGLSGDLSTIQESVKNNLGKKNIGKDFSTIFDKNFNVKNSVDSILSKVNIKSELAIILSNSSENHTYKNFKVFETVDSIKAEIKRNLCLNQNLKTIIILYGIDSNLLFAEPELSVEEPSTPPETVAIPEKEKPIVRVEKPIKTTIGKSKEKRRISNLRKPNPNNATIPTVDITPPKKSEDEEASTLDNLTDLQARKRIVKKKEIEASTSKTKKDN